MDSNLLISLINNGIVKKGTEVTILRPGRDISGKSKVYSNDNIEILLYKINESKNIILYGKSTLDNKRFKLKPQHIIKVDGMEPSRLVGAFKPEGKKRGRKPKVKES